MSIIRGEQVTISFWDGDYFVGFSCARSVTFNLLADFVGKSTIGSGDWKEKEVVALDSNISIEGAMYMNIPGMVGPPEIIDYWLNKDPVDALVSMTDTLGNNVTYSLTIIITNISGNGTVNNAGSMNITGEGTGEFLRVT